MQIKEERQASDNAFGDAVAKALKHTADRKPGGIFGGQNEVTFFDSFKQSFGEFSKQNVSAVLTGAGRATKNALSRSGIDKLLREQDEDGKDPLIEPLGALMRGSQESLKAFFDSQEDRRDEDPNEKRDEERNDTLGKILSELTTDTVRLVKAEL